MAKKVTIEFTEIQARTVLVAVEEWFRLRMGQEAELADGLVCLKHGASDFDKMLIRRNCVRELIRAMFRVAWPYGTPNMIPDEVHVASDIWSALKWELTDNRDIFREPFQMGPEPLPKITVEDVASPVVKNKV
jgi:hypothetical protein